jgi:tetratricopeptide (TPR) repeat protein
MGRFCGYILILSAVLPAILLAPAAAAAEPKIPAPSGADTLKANPDVAELLQEVRANPANAQLYGDLGNLYATKGWYDLAAATYKQAVKLDKELYPAWANMGTAHIMMEQYEDAEDAFKRALAIQPRDALAHYNLGVAQDRIGDYEKALESYRTAILYDPALLDPAVNPQVVNNAHMTSIQLMAYLDEVGVSTLPLAEMPAPVMVEGDEAAPADPAVVPVATAADAKKPILGTLILREESRPSTDQ